MPLYRILRSGWRLLPAEVRALGLVRSITQPIAGTFREHNQGLYHDDYFGTDVEPAAAKAAQTIASSVMRDIGPATLVDLGCGTGALLAEFRDRGVEVLGLEYSDAGMERTRRRNIDVRRFDVRFDAVDEIGTFDVACCTEVAEHIPSRFADRLVAAVALLGRTVIFTAATPGQGGVDHVNEQPHDYWIAKFAGRGFAHDGELSAKWRREWQDAGIQDWYWRNIMVFVTKK